ncbi:MAG: hypothetical protein ACYS9X_05690 [Planctomycetota bacterium]|jgi:hypothetical protein
MIVTSREEGYVLNKIEGDVTIRELLEYAQRNVDTWVSDPVLWDLSASSMNLDSSDFEAMRAAVESINGMVEKRRGKRTAFLASDPYSRGMLRMAIWIVECSASDSVASVFADIDEARAWLQGAD